MFPIVIPEILGVIVNTFTAYDKYSDQDFDYFGKKFFYFWNLHQILNNLKIKIIAIANVCPRSQDVENLLRPISENHGLRTPLVSQHVKASYHILSFKRCARLYIFFDFGVGVYWSGS